MAVTQVLAAESRLVWQWWEKGNSDTEYPFWPWGASDQSPEEKGCPKGPYVFHNRYQPNWHHLNAQNDDKWEAIQIPQ